MGLRFRRRISIGPGLRLNVSKSGISTSVGTRGAWLTIGPRGTRETVGLPGSGLPFTEQQSAAAPPATSSAGYHALIWIVLLAIAVGGIALWR